MQDAHTEPDNSEKRQECNGSRYFAGGLFVPLAASCPTQIIQHLACERARYHVSVDKMHCRQRMFLQNGATLKVHVQPVGGKQWVRREATILLRHPPTHSLSCDKNATLDQVSPGRPSIEEREFWVCWSVWPRWDSRPSRIFSPHTTWPLTSPLCCCSCLAKPVLNCAQIVGRYNRWPMQSHVAALG